MQLNAATGDIPPEMSYHCSDPPVDGSREGSELDLVKEGSTLTSSCVCPREAVLSPSLN